MDWDSTNLAEGCTEWTSLEHVQLMFTSPLREKEEADKCNYLLLWIGEKGRDVYNTWTLTGDEAKKLKTYYDEYTAYITPKANPLYARYTFHERIQGELESIETFVTELKLLVKDCGYQNGDEMVRDHIAFATNSPHVREKLLSQGADLTLEKAIDIARSHELAKQQLTTTGGSDHDTVHQKAASPKETVSTQETCSYCAGHHSSKDVCPAKENADAYEEDIDEEESGLHEEESGLDEEESGLDEEESVLYTDSITTEQASADVELGSPPKKAKEQSCRPTVAVMQTTKLEPVIKLHRIGVSPAKLSVKKSYPQKQPRVHGGEKKPHHCDQCGKGFTRRDSLKVHQRIHSGENPYNCDQCGKQFRRKEHLQVHQRTHTGEKPYRCDECGKTFSARANFEVHQRTHTGEKPYQCNQCEKAFSDSSDLKKHLIRHTGEKPYGCDQCEKAFSDKAGLKRHQRSHSGEKPYLCRQCGRKFSQSRNLRDHQRNHTGEKPYPCGQCGMNFSQSYRLRNHQRIHAGESYPCDQCEMNFRSRRKLEVHQRNHTREKPHLCDQCGKGFSDLSGLNKHLRSHTGEKPYICDQCGKAFSNKADLKRHQRTHTTVTSGAD